MMQDRCPLPTVRKNYGTGFGMVRGEIPRLDDASGPRVNRRETPAPVPPSRLPVVAAWVACGLLFVLAFVVASLARSFEAL